MTKFIDHEAFVARIQNEGKMTIRPSGVQQFIRCPAQWFRVHALRKPEKPSAASGAGTSLHKGAEVGYREKIKTGNLPPLNVLTDAVVETWKTESKKDVLFQEGESVAGWEKQILDGISEYYASVMPHTNPVAVEQSYTIEINSPVVSCVRGTLDIETDEGVADIKFTSKKKSDKDYLIQQSLYCLLKTRNTEKACDSVSIHNIVRGKSGSSIYVLDFKPKIEFARYWTLALIKTLESFYHTGDPLLFKGSDPVSNFLCNERWCGFWNDCPFVAGLKEK